MTVGERIIEYLKAQVGKPYKLGTRGPNTFDCSGLTKKAVELAGYRWYHGATTQWTDGFTKGYWQETGEIETLPSNILAFLFNKNSVGRMAHTGVYTGDGYVIQAGGYGGRGVHRNPINRSRWSHWATLKGVDVEMTDGIMRGAEGDNVKRIQQELFNLGYKLKPTKGDRVNGIDGKFGADTERIIREYQADNGLTVNGVWGESEEKALTEIATMKKPDETAITPVDVGDKLADLQNHLTQALLIIKGLRG